MHRPHVILNGIFTVKDPFYCPLVKSLLIQKALFGHLLLWPGVHHLAQDGQLASVVSVVVSDDHDFAQNSELEGIPDLYKWKFTYQSRYDMLLITLLGDPSGERDGISKFHPIAHPVCAKAGLAADHC